MVYNDCNHLPLMVYKGHEFRRAQLGSSGSGLKARPNRTAGAGTHHQTRQASLSLPAISGMLHVVSLGYGTLRTGGLLSVDEGFKNVPAKQGRNCSTSDLISEATHHFHHILFFWFPAIHKSQGEGKEIFLMEQQQGYRRVRAVKDVGTLASYLIIGSCDDCRQCL